LIIVITPNGQRRSHLLQPVQAGASCSTERLRQATTSRLNTRGGHAATHQPQPVQRSVSMCGSSMAQTKNQRSEHAGIFTCLETTKADTRSALVRRQALPERTGLGFRLDLQDQGDSTKFFSVVLPSSPKSSTGSVLWVV
jgi:hypothetical protein